MKQQRGEFHTATWLVGEKRQKQTDASARGGEASAPNTLHRGPSQNGSDTGADLHREQLAGRGGCRSSPSRTASPGSRCSAVGRSSSAEGCSASRLRSNHNRATTKIGRVVQFSRGAEDKVDCGKRLANLTKGGATEGRQEGRHTATKPEGGEKAVKRELRTSRGKEPAV